MLVIPCLVFTVMADFNNLDNSLAVGRNNTTHVKGSPGPVLNGTTSTRQPETRPVLPFDLLTPMYGQLYPGFGLDTAPRNKGDPCQPGLVDEVRRT